MNKDQEKLEQLMYVEGFEDEIDLMDAVGMDSTVPGICMNEDCDFTSDYEPDSTEGWCDVCETKSVKSCLVLLGVI